MKRLKKRVTIVEVAHDVGVSAATVSLVLNGRDRDLQISEATATAVREAAERLGYTPNHAARSLRRSRTNTLTILVYALLNPFYADIARSARLAAAARGYKLHIVETLGPEAEQEALHNLQSGDSDGVIVATMRHRAYPWVPETFHDVVTRGLAAVTLLDSSIDPAIPAIRIDDEADAHLAVTHLTRLGHRQIAYLTDRTAAELETGRPGHAYDRYRGYRRALAEADVTFDPTWVLTGQWSLDGGRAMVRELLGRGTPRPTALFCFNDLIAIGALRGLYEAGVRVPDDIAVVGFDGIEPTAFTTPALTTVEHSRDDLGRLAVETLLGLLDGREPATPDLVLPGRLVVRESCGTPAELREGGEMVRG